MLEKRHLIYHLDIFGSERQKIFGNLKHLWRYQIIEVHLSDLQGLFSDINSAYNFLRMAQCEYDIRSSISCEPLLLIRRQQQQL